MTSYLKVQRRMCQDCGHDTRFMGELYMVQFDLWEQMIEATGSADMLCIGCLESRLGRRLTPADFIRCPLNDDPLYDRQSLRLRQRLGHGS